jgi:hypothetical protein
LKSRSTCAQVQASIRLLTFFQFPTQAVVCRLLGWFLPGAGRQPHLELVADAGKNRLARPCPLVVLDVGICAASLSLSVSVSLSLSVSVSLSLSVSVSGDMCHDDVDAVQIRCHGEQRADEVRGPFGEGGGGGGGGGGVGGCGHYGVQPCSFVDCHLDRDRVVGKVDRDLPAALRIRQLRIRQAATGARAFRRHQVGFMSCAASSTGLSRASQIEHEERARNAQVLPRGRTHVFRSGLVGVPQP